MREEKTLDSEDSVMAGPIAISLATANPPRYVSGRETYDFLNSFYSLELEEKSLYQKLLLEGPIHGRHIAIHHDRYDNELSQDERVELFTRAGRDMATAAADKVLAQTECRAGDIAAVVVNTCTGYLCPGLTSYVVETLKLDNSVKTFDLMGMGCGGAVPNLECAAAFAGTNPDKMVLSIAVEVCSATMFRGPVPDLVVSNSIFADGASAAMIRNSQTNGHNGLFRFVDFASGIFPKYREQLRYRSEQGRLRNVLSRRVPVIGASVATNVADRLLNRHRLKRDDIDVWAIHPGGTEVLRCIEEKLGLSTEALRFSYEVFHRYGNMSSPSVMFVLKEILDKACPEAGQKGIILSFGAGFSAYAALIEFL